MGFGDFLGDVAHIGSLGLIDDDIFAAPPLPDAPDYTGAAEATSAGNLDLARQQTQANRVNEFNPLGSRTFEQGFDQAGYDAAMADWNNVSPEAAALLEQTFNISGGKFGGAPNRDDFLTDQWTSTTTLTPEQQAIFETGQQSQQRTADLGLMGLGQMEDTFGSKFSTDSLGDIGTYGDQRQRIADAMMSRVNTDIGRDRETKSAQLIAQGIPKGSEAYNREMEQLDRKQTDARQQAEIASTAQVGQTQNQEFENRRQQIAEMLSERNQPLNEYNAFQSGSQVNMPQFQAYGQAPQVAGPDYLGAATQAGQYALGDYNAQQAGDNMLMSGLFNLGAGYLAGG